MKSIVSPGTLLPSGATAAASFRHHRRFAGGAAAAPPPPRALPRRDERNDARPSVSTGADDIDLPQSADARRLCWRVCRLSEPPRRCAFASSYERLRSIADDCRSSSVTEHANGFAENELRTGDEPSVVGEPSGVADGGVPERPDGPPLAGVAMSSSSLQWVRPGVERDIARASCAIRCCRRSRLILSRWLSKTTISAPTREMRETAV